MDKFYYELTVTPNNHYDLYLDLVSSLTTEAIEELTNSIIVRSEEDISDIKDGIDLYTKAIQESMDDKLLCPTVLEKKENKDWIQKYKDAVEPVSVGKFHIHPSWTPAIEDKINILIDPALSFGSGHHETTSSCLEAISKYVKADDTLIDVGSGSGILAIGATKVGAICDICDTDDFAVKDALINFASNNVKANDSWVGSALTSNKVYDIVIANIVADVLIIINKDLKKVLKKDGILVLSGILSVYKDKVLKRFKDCTVIEEINKNEWTTLVLKKGND
ncbi:MAG TPA: 50S ribosomal protein L11 methyltransferase [Arcobacter sp.]|nr:50S ribosomal protein L11 methyltransferase [Arcobacter sp.]